MFFLYLTGTSKASQSVGRTANAAPTSVQDMGVDHRGAHISVPQQFLDRSDVIAVFQ